MYNLLAGELSPRGRRGKARGRRMGPSSLAAAAVLYGAQPYEVVDHRPRSPRTAQRATLSPRFRHPAPRVPLRPIPEVDTQRPMDCGSPGTRRHPLSSQLLPKLPEMQDSVSRRHKPRDTVSTHGDKEQSFDGTLLQHVATHRQLDGGKADNKGGVTYHLCLLVKALFLFAEASWVDPDEVEDSESGTSNGEEASISRPQREQSVTQAPHGKRSALAGPGAVSAYLVPLDILTSADTVEARGSAVASSSQLLWFSVLHQMALLLFGFSAWWLTGSPPWLGLSTYIIVGVGLWCTHWLGHRRWFWQRWFNEHTLGHHVRAYPPSKFLSERYVSVTQRSAGRALAPSTGLGLELSLNTMVYLPWPILTAILHSLVVPACGAIEIGVVLLVGLAICLEQEMIHRAVHTSGVWLERYQWFQVMRALHFLHHKDGMQHNYAMIDFFLDILSGNL
eukprot:SAG31_NODE_7186_length_1762_cov_1.696332_1_plen_448_part_10